MADRVSGEGQAIVEGNVKRIRADVASAANRSGRDPASVTIVGVTKSVGPREAAWLLDAGIADLGENRPEELLRKSADQALGAARWHMIGTYQRRKVRDTLSKVAVIHSIDSVALARAVSGHARALGRTVDVLIQVNVSGEASKHGFEPDAARAAMDEIRGLPALRWRGLMTMAPAGAPEAALRGIFARTRELRDALADASLPLPDLSMGMSADFAEAVMEGATLIRVGTALFDMGAGSAPS